MTKLHRHLKMPVHDLFQVVLDRRYEDLGHCCPKLLLIKVDEAEVFDKMTSLQHILELIRIIIVYQKYPLEDLLVIHRRLLRFIVLKFAVLDLVH